MSQTEDFTKPVYCDQLQNALAESMRRPVAQATIWKLKDGRSRPSRLIYCVGTPAADDAGFYAELN